MSRGRVYVGTGMNGIVDDEIVRRFIDPRFAVQAHGVVFCFGLPDEP